MQHQILKEAFENRNLLVPFKPEAAYFVLDSGVGAGAWILDTAEMLSSSAILHGIDIEKRGWPSVHPPNISFSINTVTKLPEEWTGKFDIVHQRLLLSALRMPEWDSALSGIHRVLQPGGWVQMCEAGRFSAGPVTERFCKFYSMMFGSRELVAEIGTELPKMLEGAGFKHVSVESRSTPLGRWAGKRGCGGRDNLINVFKAQKPAHLSTGGFGFFKTEEELDLMLKEMEDEWDSTEGAEILFHTIVAQK